MNVHLKELPYTLILPYRLILPHRLILSHRLILYEIKQRQQQKVIPITTREIWLIGHVTRLLSLNQF